MARPLKDNADWYAHQAQMRNNRKVRVLRARFGAEGYATWCMLLECLTESDRFVLGWTDLDRELLAGDFGLSVERLQEIVTCCEKIGMLSIESDTVFSKNHQEGMKPLLEVRERKRQWKQAKKPKSDGESRVSDGENPQSTDTGRDTGTGRVHNTLSGISNPPASIEAENQKSRCDTLPRAVQSIQAWSQTDQGQTEIEALRQAAMYDPQKYLDGSIQHQISGFVAHYWKTPNHQAQIKQDPIAYTQQNFCAWLSNAKRLNKPATDTTAKTQAPTGPSPKPRSPEQDYHLTKEQVTQLIRQNAPLYQDQFTAAHIHSLRQKSTARAANELIKFICKTLCTDDFTPSIPAFQQTAASA